MIRVGTAGDMKSVRPAAWGWVLSTIGVMAVGVILGAFPTAAQANQFEQSSNQPQHAEHSQAEHIRGIVTAVTDTAITVRTIENQTRTITIDSKTMIMRGSAHVTI